MVKNSFLKELLLLAGENGGKEDFLRRYALLLCQFRLAVRFGKDTKALSHEIDRVENEGLYLGLKQEVLLRINRLFLSQGEYELERNLQTLQVAEIEVK